MKPILGPEGSQVKEQAKLAEGLGAGRNAAAEKAVREGGLDLDARDGPELGRVRRSREVDDPVAGRPSRLGSGLTAPAGHDDVELPAHEPLVDLALDDVLHVRETLES